MEKPIVICLTPVRNEGWILERFLRCASLWADHIILADQGSTDGTREIARGFPKVKLIENASPSFNEPERQKLLLEEARKVPGRRLLLALDADEILSANWAGSPEWNSVLAAKSGTVIHVHWAQLDPGFSTYWTTPYKLPIGFMDDGTPHVGLPINSPRIPIPPAGPCLDLKSIRLLHYQYVDEARYRSKARWYRAWEFLHGAIQKPLILSRMYPSTTSRPLAAASAIPSRFFDEYESQGIDMTTLLRANGEIYWWDEELLRWLQRDGTGKFRRLDVWDVDWSAIARALDRGESVVCDPRNHFERRVHSWIDRTQETQTQAQNRIFGWLLRLCGW